MTEYHEYQTLKLKNDGVVQIDEKGRQLVFMRVKRGKPIRNIYKFAQCFCAKSKKDPLSCKFETTTTPPVKKTLVFDSEDYRDMFVNYVAPDIVINDDVLAQLSLNVWDDTKLSSAEGGKEKKKKEKVGLTTSIFRGMRGLVSKKKKRFKQDGFDLDLTVVTPRIIAMGFPSLGVEAKYRNPHDEVERFFDTYHPKSYKVYNLCSEKTYAPGQWNHSETTRFPFDDHHPPPFDLFLPFCQDVAEYLQKNRKNVVAIHCKAGKGRTGTVIAAFLVYYKLVTSAKDGLMYFAQKRTSNAKGVTIPSQIRYVAYFEQWLMQNWNMNKEVPQCIPVQPIFLEEVRIITVPKVNDGGINPFIELWSPRYQKDDERGESFKEYRCDWATPEKAHRKTGYYNNETEIIIAVNRTIMGDLKFMLKDSGKSGKDKKKACHWCLHTSFFPKDEGYLELSKGDIDKARKDKQCRVFDRKFKIVFKYRLSDAPEGVNAIQKKMVRRSFVADTQDNEGPPPDEDNSDEDLFPPPPHKPSASIASNSPVNDINDSSDDDEDEKWSLAQKRMFARAQFGSWPKSEIQEMVTVLQALCDGEDEGPDEDDSSEDEDFRPEAVQL